MFTPPDVHNPLLWALLIGWIMSLVLHELAHGLVAYWGGDYTVRERGGLTLNPLHYLDPWMSIILPVAFLAMGGIALPGGATRIRRDLLRNRAWNIAVSAAGPASNFLIFLALCLFLRPGAGWINYRLPVNEWTQTQIFTAGLAYSQIFAAILNLVPVPPTDGFGIISPLLPPESVQRLTRPPVGMFLFFGYYALLSFRQVEDALWYGAIAPAFTLAGVHPRPCLWAFELCLHN